MEAPPARSHLSTAEILPPPSDPSCLCPLQGMVGRPNTHKPSFEVKSEGRGRGGGGGGGRGGGRGKGRGREPDLSDCFESEEDFWNFMEDLMKHGGAPPGSPGPRGAAGGRGAGGGGKPKLSKKQRQKQKRNGW
jgi:hypothetical protein